MPRFRAHRGGLAESLATTIHVKTRAELADHVRSWPLMASFRMEDLRIEAYPSGAGELMGWQDLHIVCGRDGVLGFVEGPLK